MSFEFPQTEVSTLAHKSGATSFAAIPTITIDAEALGLLLGKAKATVLSDLSRKPWVLPPRIDIEGKKPLWLLPIVVEWLYSKTSGLTKSPPRKTRGRPPKAELVMRERAASRVSAFEVAYANT
jgi:hypothetical protein